LAVACFPSMDGIFYILENKQPKSVSSEQYVEGKKENPAPIRVAHTELEECRVSTIFLGIDAGAPFTRSPLLFETMVIEGPLNSLQQRYESWEEAEAGHQAIVKQVKHSLIQLVTER